MSNDQNVASIHALSHRLQPSLQLSWWWQWWWPWPKILWWWWSAKGWWCWCPWWCWAKWWYAFSAWSSGSPKATFCCPHISSVIESAGAMPEKLAFIFVFVFVFLYLSLYLYLYLSLRVLVLVFRIHFIELTFCLQNVHVIAFVFCLDPNLCDMYFLWSYLLTWYWKKTDKTAEILPGTLVKEL